MNSIYPVDNYDPPRVDNTRYRNVYIPYFIYLYKFLERRNILIALWVSMSFYILYALNHFFYGFSIYLSIPTSIIITLIIRIEVINENLKYIKLDNREITTIMEDNKVIEDGFFKIPAHYEDRVIISPCVVKDKVMDKNAEMTGVPKLTSANLVDELIDVKPQNLVPLMDQNTNPPTKQNLFEVIQLMMPLGREAASVLRKMRGGLHFNDRLIMLGNHDHFPEFKAIFRFTLPDCFVPECLKPFSRDYTVVNDNTIYRRRIIEGFLKGFFMEIRSGGEIQYINIHYTDECKGNLISPWEANIVKNHLPKSVTSTYQLLHLTDPNSERSSNCKPISKSKVKRKRNITVKPNSFKTQKPGNKIKEIAIDSNNAITNVSINALEVSTKVSNKVPVKNTNINRNVNTNSRPSAIVHTEFTLVEKRKKKSISNNNNSQKKNAISEIEKKKKNHNRKACIRRLDSKKPNLKKKNLPVLPNEVLMRKLHANQYDPNNVVLSSKLNNRYHILGVENASTKSSESDTDSENEQSWNKLSSGSNHEPHKGVYNSNLAFYETIKEYNNTSTDGNITIVNNDIKGSETNVIKNHKDAQEINKILDEVPDSDTPNCLQFEDSNESQSVKSSNKVNTENFNSQGNCKTNMFLLDEQEHEEKSDVMLNEINNNEKPSYPQLENNNEDISVKNLSEINSEENRDFNESTCETQENNDMNSDMESWENASHDIELNNIDDNDSNTDEDLNLGNSDYHAQLDAERVGRMKQLLNQEKQRNQEEIKKIKLREAWEIVLLSGLTKEEFQWIEDNKYLVNYSNWKKIFKQLITLQHAYEILTEGAYPPKMSSLEWGQRYLIQFRNAKKHLNYDANW